MTQTPAATSTVARAVPEGEQIFYGIMSNPMNDDPYTGYHQLRQTAPALITSDGTLVLSRHADCDAALRHRSLGKTTDMRGYLLTPVSEDEFTKAMALLQRSMSFANPPEHTRLRQPVAAAFNNRHVEALRESVIGRVDDLLDRLADGGDFMTTVAKPLPVSIMADLLGLPEADRATITPKFREFSAMAEPIVDADVFARATAAQAELAAYFGGLLAERRRNPGDDLLSRLAVTGADLDEIEIVSTVLLLFGAGIETTTNLLGNGLHTLLTHPDQLDRLRADRSLIATAVEELLRYDSPVHLDARTVLEPVTFLGVELTPGQTVTTLIGAANRDPERFDDPDRFDVGRADNAHLSFASGTHFCLGAHLTRLEAQVFLERLLDRYREVALDEAQRRPGIGLRGFGRLTVTLRS